MLTHKTRIIYGLLIIILLFIGLANTESLTYTGRAINNPGKTPLVAATFQLGDNILKEDVLNKITEGGITLKPINEEAKNEYLLLEWNKKINRLLIVMKKTGSKDASFRIWAPEERKIAEGKLTNEYELYEFDLTEQDMSFENYAFYNYGPAEIKIKKVIGFEVPESKASRLMGILTEGFI